MNKRKLFDKLLAQKGNKKISLVLGARQVGKTTLLKALYGHLSTNLRNNGLFLDLDIFTNFEKISTYENLINTLKLNGYQEAQKKFFYLFLDEFQRYEVLTIIMKNIYDAHNNIKIYASGSSSIKIKDNIQESLAGRKIINVLYPLDFEEFLWFKEAKEANIEIKNIKKLSGENLHKLAAKLSLLLEEFLVFGGYPEVALQKTANDRMEVLKSIFDLYVKKDLVEYLKIEKILKVKKLIEYLAINNGQKTKYEEVSQICALSHEEVNNYIELLRETYLLCILRPFFTNKNKELVKIPKIYFIDNGVRNFFINNFNSIGLRSDAGFLFEGYVISELIKAGIDTEFLKFWQDKNKHEVDIIIDNLKNQMPIEIKFKVTLRNEDFIGLKAFSHEYKSTKNLYLINLGVQKKMKGVNVKLPYMLGFKS